MAKIVGIKFNHSPKVYYFAPGEEQFKKGEGVIVETARGVEYGIVSIEPEEVQDESLTAPLKPIIRKATKKDEEKVAECEKKAKNAFAVTQEKIDKHKLDMKLVDIEFAFDGSKAVFYFSAPSRIDFRDLVKDLAFAFHTRIELRQIGSRDEVKILGGLGPCGRECCCAGAISNFKKVTIRMAKVQGLSLNPGKISGLCGRLMCCLEYENPHYTETFSKMPKIGSEVITPDGRATVVSNNMLTYLVKVKFEQRDGTVTYNEFPLDMIKVKSRNKAEDVDDSSGADLKKLED